MGIKTPWDRAEGPKEFDQQSALVQWRNMAIMFGLRAAMDPDSYTRNGVAGRHREAERSEYEPSSSWDKWSPPTELEWLHAVKNQGHGDAVRGSRSKMEGVEAGVSDMFLPYPIVMDRNEPPFPGALVMGNSSLYCGLYVELKRDDKGKMSDPQEAFQGFVRSKGYACELAFGWEHAAQILLVYLGYLPRVQPKLRLHEVLRP